MSVSSDRSNQTKLRRWRRWIRELEREVVVLYWNRAIHRRIREVVAGNPELNYANPLHEWIHSNYVAANLVRLRRLLDVPSRRHKNLSLQVLLKELAADPAAISPRIVNGNFRFGGKRHPSPYVSRRPSGEYVVDGEKVERACKKLENATAPATGFVDKYIAHRDRRRGRAPTFETVDRAIDAASTVFNELCVHLTGAKFVGFEPSDLTEWDRILEIPWIPNREAIELQADRGAGRLDSDLEQENW